MASEEGVKGDRARLCVCVWFLHRILAEFLIKLKLLIDSLRGCSTHVPVLPGVPTIRDYSDFPPILPACAPRNTHLRNTFFTNNSEEACLFFTTELIKGETGYSVYDK